MADFDNLTANITSAISAATPDYSADPTPASDPTPSPAPQDAAPPEPDAPVAEEEFEFPAEDASPAPEEAVVPEPADEADTQASGITKLTDAEGKPLSWAKLREALFTDPRGHKLFKGFQLARELEKPMDQGGLGGVPSVEALREMHQDSQNLRMMAHRFHHGDPRYAEGFVQQWFAPGPNGHSPGAQLVAKNFLDSIHKMANDANQPDAYRHHAGEMYKQAALPAVLNQIEDMYQRGYAEADPERRLALLNGARIWEEDITGNMRKLPDGIETAEYSKTQPQVDPRSADVDAKIRRIDEFQSNQARQAEAQFAQSFNGEINTRLEADVDIALKALSEALPPRVFAASKASFVKELGERLRGNPAQMQTFEMARDKASRSRSPQDVQAAADAWRSVARPIIKQLRAEYNKDAQPQIEAVSAKRHATHAEAAQKTGTSSVAQPVVRNLANGPGTRLPGESHDEYINRVTRVAVSAAS